MAERVSVAQLRPGDWVGEINGKYLDPEQKVVQVTQGFVFNGIGEWGILLSDGRSFFLKGPVETSTVYRADPNEAVMLDLQASSERSDARMQRENERAMRTDPDRSARRLLQQLMRRTK